MLSRICFWLATLTLLLCSNGWIVGTLTRPLERHYLPSTPMPDADCIVVLANGTLNRLPPRPTIEVSQEGDRILYAAHLFQQGKANRIICTGGLATDPVGIRPDAEDMAEFLEMLNVPKRAIILETKARNTHEHAVNLRPCLQENGYTRVLLVTSAMHMPRALGVFRRSCPGVEFIPAPTDFRAVDYGAATSCRLFLQNVTPRPRTVLDCSSLLHEYAGIMYYKVRGWM